MRCHQTLAAALAKGGAVLAAGRGWKRNNQTRGGGTQHEQQIGNVGVSQVVEISHVPDITEFLPPLLSGYSE